MTRNASTTASVSITWNNKIDWLFNIMVLNARTMYTADLYISLYVALS